MILNKNPNITKALMLPSTTFRGRIIECDLARTITLTARVTYDASGTVSANVNLYYTPDGINFDTLTFTTYAITITAGATIQRSAVIDPPEVGYLVPVIQNADTVYNITNISLWTSVSKYWEDYHKAIEQSLTRKV